MLRQHFINSRNSRTGLVKAKKACGAAVSSFVFLLACLCGAIVSAENRPLETKGPVVITSSSLTADNKAHTALFEGSVVARSDDMSMSSDKMLVTYTEGGAITRIDADGHVKLIRNERVITSDTAIYFADEEKVVFTGDPRAAEGGNVVTGTKMIYLMKEDRSIVENSKVFIKDKKGK